MPKCQGSKHDHAEHSSTIGRVGNVEVVLRGILVRTWTTSSTALETPPEYSDKETPLRRALGGVALLVGFSTGNPPRLGTFTAGNGTRNRTRRRTPPETPLLRKLAPVKTTL